MRPEWIEDLAAVPELIDLFTRCAGTAYICNGELLDGRAESITSWSEDLPSLLSGEFSEAIGSGTGPDGRRAGILAVRIDAAIRGFAFVEIFRSARTRPHAFLHDIVVDPESRGRGIGADLMTRLKDELLREGVDRLFLESGMGNLQAHVFFERHGFRKLSISMMAELGAAPHSPLSSMPCLRETVS